MNKRIGIFYFSATGNTEIVTSLIKEEFMRHKCNVEINKIEDVLQKKIAINPDGYDIIGIGSPVIAFVSPKIVQDFIKIMPNVNSKEVFIFKTAGGVGPLNYNSSASIIKKLIKKGYDVVYERIFSFFVIKEGYNPYTILKSSSDEDKKYFYIPPFMPEYIKNDEL